MRVEINKLGINGEGVARATVPPYENKVCFVKYIYCIIFIFYYVI
jgi:tRNA/tmRNA/rRNA uracil-C5-methylase (TrmA/RlmC/RlmD family)